MSLLSFDAEETLAAWPSTGPFAGPYPSRWPSHFTHLAQKIRQESTEA